MRNDERGNASPFHACFPFHASSLLAHFFRLFLRFGFLFPLELAPSPSSSLPEPRLGLGEVLRRPLERLMRPLAACGVPR